MPNASGRAFERRSKCGGQLEIHAMQPHTTACRNCCICLPTLRKRGKTRGGSYLVMAGLVPAIPIVWAPSPADRDRRDKPGDDELAATNFAPLTPLRHNPVLFWQRRDGAQGIGRNQFRSGEIEPAGRFIIASWLRMSRAVPAVFSGGFPGSTTTWVPTVTRL